MQLPTVPSPAKPAVQPPQVVPPGHSELVSQAEEQAGVVRAHAENGLVVMNGRVRGHFAGLTGAGAGRVGDGADGALVAETLADVGGARGRGGGAARAREAAAHAGGTGQAAVGAGRAVWREEDATRPTNVRRGPSS